MAGDEPAEEDPPEGMLCRCSLSEISTGRQRCISNRKCGTKAFDWSDSTVLEAVVTVAVLVTEVLVKRR